MLKVFGHPKRSRAGPLRVSVLGLDDVLKPNDVLDEITISDLFSKDGIKIESMIVEETFPRDVARLVVGYISQSVTLQFLKKRINSSHSFWRSLYDAASRSGTSMMSLRQFFDWVEEMFESTPRDALCWTQLEELTGPSFRSDYFVKVQDIVSNDHKYFREANSFVTSFSLAAILSRDEQVFLLDPTDPLPSMAGVGYILCLETIGLLLVLELANPEV
jgi:hypothetical protein